MPASETLSDSEKAQTHKWNQTELFQKQICTLTSIESVKYKFASMLTPFTTE